MIKILPNAKFSYNYTRGTITKRFKQGEEFNERIFNRILQLYDNKTACGIGVIKNSYNKYLPEGKNIDIVPMQIRDYEEYGGSTRVEELEGYLLGYTIEMPVNKKKKLNILELPAFMHESTHVMDYLFNPKYIANYRKMCEKRIYDKDYYNIYEKWFYNTDDITPNNKKEVLAKVEEETRKTLQHLPSEEKIIFLNYIKYSMTMEKHAYEQGVKFAKMLSALKKQVDEESLDDYSNLICFKEKIEIVNRLIKEEIEESRLENLFR